MRSYHHYCSVARGLDVVGDRWTLLIVRELLLQGSCRFTDLKNGLPGIATNLLSTRLKELESAGLITREDAPPPVATVLYGLSESGRELEPVLKALGILKQDGWIESQQGKGSFVRGRPPSERSSPQYARDAVDRDRPVARPVLRRQPPLGRAVPNPLVRVVDRVLALRDGRAP